MRKRKKQQLKKRHKTKFYIIFLLIFIGLSIIIFNDFGLIKLADLKKKKYKLQNNIQFLVNQQIKLNSEISELTTNVEYIEKIAREKFMMAKPGEKIFKVIEYKELK
tara:strand:+ start:179 stop:499 length:321 start_codon:yes stop_codon:yes gene_type:complete